MVAHENKHLTVADPCETLLKCQAEEILVEISSATIHCGNVLIGE